jgi:RsiW-degrading membrane proteinase PrsW (M82 family)
MTSTLPPHHPPQGWPQQVPPPAWAPQSLQQPQPTWQPPQPMSPPQPMWQPPQQVWAPIDADTKAADTESADRKLMIGGGACIAIGLVSVILRLSGALPSGIAVVVILLVVVVGLRIFIGYAAKSASSSHRQRVTRLITLSGLAISGVSVIAALPRLVQGGGSDHFESNVLAHLWTIAILLLIAGTARTLNWLTLVGLGLTAFLSVTGLAFTVGRPVVNALGQDDTFATVVYVPFTEEVLKALPALVLLIFAARRRNARPSAIEMALLGAILGAGFAVYEDAQYHRGGFNFTAMPLVSFLNPSAMNDSSLNVAYGVGGHMIWTSLIVFGLGFGLLYRRRFAWAPLAIPVTFAVGLVEHITQNYAGLVATGQGDSSIFDLLRVLTLWGWLSSLLLIGGVAWLARIERRATGDGRPLKDTVQSSFWLRPVQAGRASAALAAAQLGGAPVLQGASR